MRNNNGAFEGMFRTHQRKAAEKERKERADAIVLPAPMTQSIEFLMPLNEKGRRPVNFKAKRIKVNYRPERRSANIGQSSINHRSAVAEVKRFARKKDR